MERTQIHNIQIGIGEWQAEDLTRFLQEHSVSLEPGGPAEEAQAEGKRFAAFLAEFCDPSWLKGLSDALSAQPSMNEKEIEALCQVYQAVQLACVFHRRRDQMNAALHADNVHFSPLTKKLDDASYELLQLLEPYARLKTPYNFFKRTEGIT